jgi:hypothetical protein
MSETSVRKKMKSMEQDFDDAIKPSALRRIYREKIERYRLESERANTGVESAMRGLRDARADGGSDEVRAAIDEVRSRLSEQSQVLADHLADPDLEDADRARIEEERESTADAAVRMGADRFSAPLEQTARIDQAEADDARMSYLGDLRAYGTGAKTSADLDREEAALSDEYSADRQLAGGADGELGQARFSDRGDRVERSIDEVRVQAAAYAPSPELEAKYLRERSSLQHAGGQIGMDAIRAELMGTLGEMIQELGRQFAAGASAPGATSSEKAEMGVQYEREVGPLLDEQEQAGRALDRSLIERLPQLTVGGTSFSERYMPSAAQAAGELERIGMGRPAAQTGGAPVPDKLVGGDITVVVNVPGVGKLISKAPVASVQKASETSGMGSHYPGM